MENLIFRGTPVLETERLILRKLRIGDSSDIYEYASDPEVSKYVTWNTHRSPDDSAGFIRYTLGRYDRDEAGEWGIVLKETNKLIGSFGFIWVESAQYCGQIGYVISRRYWNRGLMTEAVKRLIDFGFDEMGLNRIEAVHILENEASGKVMSKAGMMPEGVQRSKVFVKGSFYDVRIYAIIKSDIRNV